MGDPARHFADWGVVEMLIFAAIAGAALLYACVSKLVEIASYLRDIRSSASHIQLEVDGLLQRHAAMEEMAEDMQEKLRQICSVAESYEDEVLSPVRRAHAEAEFFRDIRN